MSESPDLPWLVTGGAGYIGGHVVERLLTSGYRVVVVDDLSTGDARRLPPGVPLLRTSVLDTASVQSFIKRERPRGVIHLAAKKSPAESVADPLLYASENTGGLIALLSSMTTEGVRRIVFSSSCAVYGEGASGLIAESHPTKPVSPYGESKLYGEQLLAGLATAQGFRSVALRYFNVAGTTSTRLSDRSGVNLIPNVLRAAADGTRMTVFGTDYATRDGSCVRDYVDIRDIADAHVAAAVAIDTGAPFRAYNVGTGRGTSVFQVIAAAERVSRRRIRRTGEARRAGDPAEIVADVNKIAHDLGWQSRYTLDNIVASAWNAIARSEP